MLAGISNFPSTSPSSSLDSTTRNPTGRNDNEQTANQIQSPPNPHSIISSTKMFMAAVQKIFKHFFSWCIPAQRTRYHVCAPSVGVQKSFRLCQISLLSRLISEPRRRDGISCKSEQPTRFDSIELRFCQSSKLWILRANSCNQY